ncbi:MAG: TonB-dependent receptor [Sandaracinaceae bacterium]
MRAAALAAVLLTAGTARAQDAELSVEARVHPADDPSADRARTVVDRAELEERIPRSAPDALRAVPGVSVQQTAHGQASPYVRGLTGQRVVHLFDGIRLNTGIYRQGPNQYFFTVDSATLERLEVVRGSASTAWGPDALGGAILAVPRERRPDASLDGVRFAPAVTTRFRSADLEWGGRGELGADLGDRVSLLGGVGFRVASELRSGGVVGSPVDGSRALVPRFTEELAGRPMDEWHTQAGTGFREITFDGRLVYRVAPRLRAVGAVYGYRQSDAPRTDRCPPPEAPADECTTVREQSRTLAYLALRGDAGREVRDLDVSLSYQRHHERRDTVRPRSSVRFDWLDDVDTLGFVARAATPTMRLDEQAWLRVRYGVDAYRDGVASSAFQTLTDLPLVIPLSRGQYADRSSYATLGTHATLELSPLRGLVVRGGGRLGLVGVRAPGDGASGTRAVRDDFGVSVGRVGVEIQPLPELGFVVSVDQGVRAPNLDDLTSRQQTGPGFQFENPDLRPERSTSLDAGVRVRLPWLTLDAFAFGLLIEDGITRALRGAADCPPGTPACAASRVHLQLVNTRGLATLFGAEGGATVRLPEGVTARATVAFAWGEGPDPSGEGRVPLSRVPPLNGTVEGRWRHAETGIYAGAILRWAATQDRLAPSDAADARIPVGGTPGWATVDLSAGWRFDEHLLLALVVENLFDIAYRVHGSSINAPGVGVMASLTVRPWLR